jgi:outer membrane protein OmpA-like peptidoglycan-associated protein/ABC-type nitrate/sulfonate/bicarbonate transport system substrate-binding protein
VNVHVKIAAALVALGVALALAYKYVWPIVETRMDIATTDARATKGRIVIGVDNWIGYFPLCSDEMRKRMRTAGYVLRCDDDKADYAKRLANLRSGQLQFAVATVDAFVINGPASGFPGAIVAVIDESKGGDAIVAWKDKAASLDALKAAQTPTIAFTPASPSEHLLRAAAVHFDVPALRTGKGAWRIETNGSPEALKRLLEHKTDAAVVWEPDVTRALATDGVVKLLSTADTQRLIVDVLIAGRSVLQQNPEMVKTLLTTYFEVARHYREHPDVLAKDVAAETKVSMEQVKTMLAGVAMAGLTDNFQIWLGTTPETNGMVDVIQSTVRILTETGAFASDPLPDKDPYRIINSQFIGSVFTLTATGGQPTATLASAALDQRFKELSDEEWSRLREVGTLKALSVSFQSGTADLSYDGKTEIDRTMDVLRHYPTFRVRVRGHTAESGDPEQNKLLSLERAEAVARYLNVTYNVDPNRIKVVGMGSSQPLPRLPNESDRAYQYRLPRVEVSLLADAL